MSQIPASIYKLLFDTSPHAFFLAKKDGTILEANEAASDMFGYTKEEIVQIDKNNIIDFTDSSFLKMLENGVKGSSSKDILTGKHKNGTRFPVGVASVVLKEEDGNDLLGCIVSDISEQISQQQQLKLLLEQTNRIHQNEEDSRLLLESVLSNITDGFFIVDQAGEILFWNKAAETLMQKKGDVLIGKNLWEEFPELGILKERVEYPLIYDQKKSVRFREYFPQCRIWADVSVYPSDKNFSVYFKDVTEIKNLRTLEKLEREVLEMNARTGSILEDTLDFYLREIQNIHTGMICTVMRLKNNQLFNWSAPNLSQNFRSAIDGIIIGENVGCCGTAAFRKEKVVVADIMNDPLWVDFKTLAAKEGLKACGSFPLINAAGKIIGTFAIYYKNIKLPSHAEENTIERAKNLLLIILENAIAQEDIKMSKLRYDLVAKATNDIIWEWDILNNTFQSANEGFNRLLGMSDSVMFDYEKWSQWIHPDDFKRVVEKRLDILRNPDNVLWEDEFRIANHKGYYFFTYNKAYIIRDDKGKAIRLFGVTQNISQRKEDEALLLELNNRLKQRAEELAASNVELERFAYIASHDMQEPLRMITSFLQLFKKKYEDQIDETAEQYIHFAVDGADRMKKLITDLLEYSRIGSNKDSFEEIDLQALVNDVVAVFMNRIQETNAVIHFTNLPVLKGNKTQLFQLFQNLIGNALKYCDKAIPEIEITGKDDGKYYLFSVRDNGIGIKPVFFEKIFILFQRLHHKNEYSGTGIGLTVCKKIVERHNGKIWVESEPGIGSCFYFTISKHVEEYRFANDKSVN